MTRNLQETDDPVAPDLEDPISHRVSRLHCRLNAQAARVLEDAANISLSQWRILVTVDAFGEISASDIVRHTQIDKAMVSRGIKSLHAQGLVAVLVSETDQRLHNVKLTPAGQERFQLAWPRMREHHQGLLNALSKEEHQTLLDIIGKLEAALVAMDDV